jgi:plasmid stabilization system protein ParE
LLAEINERINLLPSHPELGRKVDFKDSRVLSMGYYSIFYKIFNGRIIITAFWDTRQDPEKLLQLLK